MEADFYSDWDVDTRLKKEKAGFRPDQERDYRGRWSVEGHLHSPEGALEGRAKPRPGEFKSLKQASAWLKKHIAKEVFISDKYTIEDCNAMMEPLVMAQEYAPLKTKLNFFWTFTTMAGTSGEYNYEGPTKSSMAVNLGDKGGSLLPPLNERYKLLIQKEVDELNQIGREIQRREEQLAWLLEHHETSTEDGWSYEKLKDWISNREAKRSRIEKNIKQMRAGKLKFPSTMDLLDTEIGGAVVHVYGHARHDQHQAEVVAQFGCGFKLIDK